MIDFLTYALATIGIVTIIGGVAMFVYLYLIDDGGPK